MRVTLSPKARKALLRSNKRQLISEKLHKLAEEPLPLTNNVTQLRNRPEFRLRIQDWRVIFVMTEDEIIVRDIAPRGSAYEEKT